MNGWNASYEESTGVFIGDVATAKSNTDIAKITLTFKDNVKAGTTSAFQLTKFNLTDGENDFLSNQEVTVKIIEKADPDK